MKDELHELGSFQRSSGELHAPTLAPGEVAGPGMGGDMEGVAMATSQQEGEDFEMGICLITTLLLVRGSSNPAIQKEGLKKHQATGCVMDYY